jgi:cytochrome c-type biogenesis protein CcmH
MRHFLRLGLITLLLTSCNQFEFLLEKNSSISGTITIDATLASRVNVQDRLFIIARRTEGGPPLAVQRIVAPQFPLRYWLTREDVMMPGVEFTGSVNVIARIDKDGKAGTPQPGDLEGSFPGNPVQVGAQKVDIVIDKLY